MLVRKRSFAIWSKSCKTKSRFVPYFTKWILHPGRSPVVEYGSHRRMVIRNVESWEWCLQNLLFERRLLFRLRICPLRKWYASIFLLLLFPYACYAITVVVVFSLRNFFFFAILLLPSPPAGFHLVWYPTPKKKFFSEPSCRVEKPSHKCLLFQSKFASRHHSRNMIVFLYIFWRSTFFEKQDSFFQIRWACGDSLQYYDRPYHN